MGETSFASPRENLTGRSKSSDAIADDLMALRNYRASSCCKDGRHASDIDLKSGITSNGKRIRGRVKASTDDITITGGISSTAKRGEEP